MEKYPSLSHAQLESVAELLGERAYGEEISRALDSMELEDISGESTKWRRIYGVFRFHQDQDGSCEKLAKFIEIILDPAKFWRNPDSFDDARTAINSILKRRGLTYSEEGEVSRLEPGDTSTEAEHSGKGLAPMEDRRGYHTFVADHCTEANLRGSGIQAVTAAMKELTARIQRMSGKTVDGSKLADEVFLGKNPVVAINPLEDETDRSEQHGFGLLLKGCYLLVRNPLAHETEEDWRGKGYATAYLSLISLLHDKLDGVPPGNESGKT